MTYAELTREKKIALAESGKNRNVFEEVVSAELYELTKGGGCGSKVLLSLADVFLIADYVKENFPDRG